MVPSPNCNWLTQHIVKTVGYSVNTPVTGDCTHCHRPTEAVIDRLNGQPPIIHCQRLPWEGSRQAGCAPIGKWCNVAASGGSKMTTSVCHRVQ